LPEGFKENAAQGYTSIKLIKPHLVIQKGTYTYRYNEGYDRR